MYLIHTEWFCFHKSQSLVLLNPYDMQLFKKNPEIVGVLICFITQISNNRLATQKVYRVNCVFLATTIFNL